MLTKRSISILFCCLLTASDGAECADPYGGWAYYGGTQDGIRYSSLGQIKRSNVEDLEVAWTYHTGEIIRRRENEWAAAMGAGMTSGFEDYDNPFNPGQHPQSESVDQK